MDNFSGATTTLAAYFALGATATYGAGRTLGYLPGWFGPERSHWNSLEWSKEAQHAIAQFETDATYTCTARVYDGKGARRVRFARYFSLTEKAIKGVVKFGSDCEGPPRCVHGGCTAATANQIAIDLASNLLGFPVAYSSNLNVDYLIKIPLGSQLGFDCVLSENEQLASRIVTKVRFFSLSKPDQVFAQARVLFENVQCVSRL
jgi:hypothetical protein